jgi:hypothetical protein
MGLYLICGYRPNMHHMKRRPLTSLGCTVGCIAGPRKDVLDVLRFGRMY